MNKKSKKLIMIAPSFIAEFNYPEIIHQLKDNGFDKVVELTFGAKLVNKEYHNILKKTKKKWISSVCPGIVEYVKNKYPNLKNNLMPIDSPMIAMAKVCRKEYPEHKITFLSPCYAKKREAELYGKGLIDEVIGYNELKEKVKKIRKNKITFDKFYNDYTKIYPLTGGLSKTAHLKGILKKGQEIEIDGINEINKMIDNINKENIRFFDANFCKGGCIGGPCLTNKDLKENKKKVLNYLKKAKKEDIPDCRKGLLKRADGIKLFKQF
jgi:iron only hydrogenase large subunit-like protein